MGTMLLCPEQGGDSDQHEADQSRASGDRHEHDSSLEVSTEPAQVFPRQFQIGTKVIGQQFWLADKEAYQRRDHEYRPDCQ